MGSNGALPTSLPTAMAFQHHFHGDALPTHIGNAGARMLADALQYNSTLTSLHLLPVEWDPTVPFQHRFQRRWPSNITSMVMPFQHTLVMLVQECWQMHCNTIAP